VGAVAEALEALGHPAGALPEPRLLANLFVRFQAQVPLRASAGAGPEEALAAWLEDGAGLCGAPRVAAFEALAAAAGFSLSRAGARHPDGTSRAVLLSEGGRLLLDAAFPLPAPLPIDPPGEGEATGYGALSVRAADGLPALFLETRGDERELFRVEPAAGAGSAPGEEGPALFRLLDDRLLRWKDGVLEVSDAWSRLRAPLPATDADGLEALFGPPVPEGLPEGTPPAAATLAAYHASAESPGRLRSLLADPETATALVPDGWTVENLARRGDGFDLDLVEAGELLRRERVTILPDGSSVEAEGPLALFRTRTFRLEPRPFGTRLRLLATLRDPVPPRGLPEATRRRLVFELASELLALDRLASGA
jgi:hypothetical protein